MTVTYEVGVVYDELFLLHKSPRRGHEERPARLLSIVHLLREKRLWDSLVKVSSRSATMEELLTVHNGPYLRKLERIDKIEDVDRKLEKIHDYTADLYDVYMNEFTIKCAKHAAGSSIEAVNAVIGSNLSSCIAIVRPPGHHAESHCAQGFCVYNNVAIAAKHALDKLGLERIMIVDWDIHHGNGTQRTFYDDSRVVYCSIHRYDYGKFYPSSQDASPTRVGEGNASGTNVNIAWNGTGHGDAEYKMAFDKVIIPVGQVFEPQLIIISAGFDAAHGDAMGECSVSPMGYAMMTRSLKKLAKTVLVLEGGYHLPSLSSSVVACTSELMGTIDESEFVDFEDSLSLPNVKESALESIKETQLNLKPYYKLPEI